MLTASSCKVAWPRPCVALLELPSDNNKDDPRIVLILQNKKKKTINDLLIHTPREVSATDWHWKVQELLCLLLCFHFKLYFNGKLLFKNTKNVAFQMIPATPQNCKAHSCFLVKLQSIPNLKLNSKTNLFLFFSWVQLRRFSSQNNQTKLKSVGCSTSYSFFYFSIFFPHNTLTVPTLSPKVTPTNICHHVRCQ